MQQSSSLQFEDLVARRLLKEVTRDSRSSLTAPVPVAGIVATEQGSDDAVDLDFIKIEKNLAELGFFTPASKRVKNLKSKTITFTRIIDGNRVEGKITFVPGALYGLPSTADQDKWLAFQKFVTEIQQVFGHVSNPVTFLSADMLRLLGQTASGTNFKDIDEWLDRMWSTSIISEGMVYYAGKKVRVKDRTPIKVFTRAVTAGAKLEDGTVAEKNYVWLSDWQLENVNNNYQMPVDFEAYKKLKNNIAKTLVPLLQIWLYATRRKGTFEKRYDEICQLLDTTQYNHASKIAEKLGPSLDELKEHEYLAAWKIEKTSDGHGFKIILKHGPKFYGDLKRRKLVNDSEPEGELDLPIEQTARPVRPRQAPLQLQSDVSPESLAALTSRGVSETKARRLLAGLPANFPVADTLEWGDTEIARQPGKWHTPAGFYISLLQARTTPPPTFQSSAARKAQHEANLKQQEAFQEAADKQRQREDQEEAQATANLTELEATAPDRFQALYREAKEELFSNPIMTGQKNHPAAWHDGAIRSRMKKLLPEFLQRLNRAPSPGQGSATTPIDLQAILTTLQLPSPEPTQPTPEPQRWPPPQPGELDPKQPPRTPDPEPPPGPKAETE